MTLTRYEFTSAVTALLGIARLMGRQHLDINAGKLHRYLGDYPNPKRHRMPVCCQVMRDAMRPGDLILMQPRKGAGASLTIRYFLESSSN